MAQATDSRKLAAVMFADIEGYTAMFQRDEKAGLEQIGIHRNDLKAITEKYRGTIIQYFGDGSLTVFDSVIDAVQCAIELQITSKTTSIPLRVGIHIGDMVMRSNDVFGDVVNVASRIQSAGIAGSVIISKKVADELVNQPGLKVKEIGFFSLKNVREPQELFAVIAPGLTIPGKHHERKKWSAAYKIGMIALALLLMVGYIFRNQIPIFKSAAFDQQRVYIESFENNTQDTSLNIYGDIARDWITNDIVQSAEANVVSGERLIFAKADIRSLAENMGLFQESKIDLIIRGSYNYAGKGKDSLMFQASIIDAKTNDIIPINVPRAFCSVDDYRFCLMAISNVITGYWVTKDKNLFSHPTNEAYKAYVKAKKNWSAPDRNVALKYLRQSIALDTTFLNAYFLLMEGLNNQEKYEEAIDTLKLIQLRFPDLNPEQENYIKYHEEDLRGRRRIAFDYFYKAYKKETDDLFMNTSAMVMAMEYLNDPLLTLSINKKMDSDEMDLMTCDYCRVRMLMAMLAYRSLSDIAQAKKLADRLRLHAVRRTEFNRLLEFYVSIGDFSSVESILGRLSADTTTQEMVPLLTYNAARQSLLYGYVQQKIKYARQAADMFKPKADRSYAKCLYLLDDLSGAEKVYLNAMATSTPGINTLGELGVIYARLGNEQKALDMIANLKIKEKPIYYGLTKYQEARILAQLGKKQEAIALLHQSLEEGMQFLTFSFQNDPDLIVLNSEPAYLKLLSSRRFPELLK